MATFFAAPLQAQSLVKDGGFEGITSQGAQRYDAPGTFGAWQVTQGTVYVTLAQSVHTGRYALDLGPNFQTNSVSQLLPTVAGQQYDLSFFVYVNDSANTFGVDFGGSPVPGAPTTVPTNGSGGSVFNSYSFPVMAPASGSVLAFSGYGGHGHVILDDVSLTPVPEAATNAGLSLLLALGFTGFVASRGKSTKA